MANYAGNRAHKGFLSVSGRGTSHALMTGTAKVSGYTHIDRKPEPILAKVPDLTVESEKRMYGSMVYLYTLKKRE